MQESIAGQVETRPSTPADLNDLTKLVLIPGLAEAAGLTLGANPAGVSWALQTWANAGQLWSVWVQNRVVGLVAAFPVGPNQRELGYLLNPEWWGRGIMTAAVDRVVAAVGDQELVATTALGNQASQKILAHQGFTEIHRDGATQYWRRQPGQN